ncbi:MAG: DUF3852 domain-containing protein [Oscillospiraceae bacterium]|nr:DUF3852 domain-containing protein [Oscillospiraceae bacterium]
MKRNKLRFILALAAALALLAGAFCVTAAAAPGDVAPAIESTWNAAKGQIETIVNKVIFPALDLILAVLLFVKIGSTYMDYRKHGQLELTAPIVIFAGLLFCLLAPQFLWKIIA